MRRKSRFKFQIYVALNFGGGSKKRVRQHFDKIEIQKSKEDL